MGGDGRLVPRMDTFVALCLGKVERNELSNHEFPCVNHNRTRLGIVPRRADPMHQVAS